MNRYLLLTIGLLLTGPARAELLITEIMYRPTPPRDAAPVRAQLDRADEDRPEPIRTEWVEVHNSGDEPIEVGDYHLADGDGRTTGLPKGAVILPGHSVVLIPAACPLAEFHAAWGEDITVWQLDRWGAEGLDGLDDNPSKVNQQLELRDAQGEVVDAVPYRDEGAWPEEAPAGASIYLRLAGFTPVDNDAVANWARSAPGIDGAWTSEETDLFTGRDVGSPGTIPPRIDDEKPVPMPDEK